MKTLLELQHHFNFDTDKQLHHFYLSEYDKWFLPYKYKDGKILELGVSKGGSLSLWREYFPNMTLVGIDLNPLGTDAYGNHPTVTPTLPSNTIFLQKDGYTESTIRELVRSGIFNVDIIIDDGSHNLEDQIFVIKFYHAVLAEKGLLIIEDIPRKNIIPILNTCYTHLISKLFRLTLIDNNNSRHLPPDRYPCQNYGNVALENSLSDDSILIIEFF